MTVGSYKNLTRLLGQLADVNIKDAITGDTLVKDSNGIWVAEAGGALHAAVTVSNASNAAVSLTLGSNQELSASFSVSNAGTLSVPLTGFSASAGTIAATDTVIQAFNKAQGSITNLENINVRATRFIAIGSGTSGTITIPTNNTIVLDDFGGTVDAVITTSSGGKPAGLPALDTNGAVISTTFDTNGAYSLSGTPASYPVALVYRTRTKWINYDDTAADIAGDKEVESDHNALVNVQGGTSGQYYHLTAAQHTIATTAATATNAGYVDTNTQSFGGTKTLALSSNSTLTGLTTIGAITSTALTLALNELNSAVYDDARGGLINYDGTPPRFTYTESNGTFTLDDSGTGRIRGKQLTWLGGQSVTVNLGEFCHIAIDTNATLVKLSTWSIADQCANVRLFTMIRTAGGAYQIVNNAHRYCMDHGALNWIRDGFGTVIAPIQYGSADIARYTTATGTNATDRMVKIASGAVIDGDITEQWSAITNGITILHAYTTTNGTEVYSLAQEFPMYYSSNGTPTLISSGSRGVFRLYANKTDGSSTNQQFSSEMHTAQFSTLTQAQNAINAGTIAGLGTYNQETAQIGFVVVRNNASGGYVEYVQIAKKTLQQLQGASGGASTTAAQVNCSVTEFDNILTAADTTVQTALDALDNGAVGVSNTGDITGIKTFTAVTTISATNASTTTTNGALVVTGGVGIGGEVRAGGDIYTGTNKVCTEAKAKAYAIALG